jgi:hypothetical protein
MSNPQLPPYLGSWEELVKALLHNPFLGGGGRRIASRMQEDYPNPDDTTVSHHPPRPNELTALLLGQISLRQSATRLPKEQGSEVVTQIDAAIADEIDFICGTGPILGRFGPHPPKGTVIAVVSELNLIANNMQEGGLRTEVERLATNLLEAGLRSVQISSTRTQEKKAAA